MGRRRIENREYQITDHNIWLGHRDGIVYRFWWDKERQRTCRTSTGNTDIKEEYRILMQEFLTDREMNNAATAKVDVSTVMMRYYEQYAKKLPSAASQRRSRDLWVAWWGDRTVDEITPGMQERFVEHLYSIKVERTGQTLSRSTVSKVLSYGRAALNRMRKRGELASAPDIMEVEKKADRQNRKLKGRPLTSIKEIARLFDWTAENDTPEAMMYWMLLANTMARPGAILELTPAQYDSEFGILRLNPEGRKQTRKVRPVVPVTNTLRPWLERPLPVYQSRRVTRQATTYVHYLGKPILNTMRRPTPEASKAAGLPLNSDGTAAVNGYSFRHGIARLLRWREVSPAEIEIMLGHYVPGGHSETSAVYAPYYAPDYCKQAVKVIDEIMAEVQAECRVAVLIGPSPMLAARSA